MKILLTLLTSNDLPRLKRLIGSVLNLTPVKEIELKAIVVLNTLTKIMHKKYLTLIFHFLL